MKLSILIADDEKPARNKLKRYLRSRHVGRILEAENGIEAVKIIRKHKPHLVFLDIQMPGMTGFEVIETIGVDKMPAVVFVTAYDQYAIDAFEVQAIDYLLKPFDSQRFEQSLNRSLDQISRRSEEVNPLNSLLNHVNSGKFLDRILVNAGFRYSFVKTTDIIFMTAEEKYVRLHTRDGEHLIRDTMNRLETRLDPERFVRIHRSHIVNIDAIKEMQPWSHGDYVVILKDGTRLTLSRRYRERLFRKAS